MLTSTPSPFFALMNICSRLTSSLVGNLPMLSVMFSLAMIVLHFSRKSLIVASASSAAKRVASSNSACAFAYASSAAAAAAPSPALLAALARSSVCFFCSILTPKDELRKGNRRWYAVLWAALRGRRAKHASQGHVHSHTIRTVWLPRTLS